MSLFSPEEKEEFENVGVRVKSIELMLPKKYHPIFKELIQAILLEKIVEVPTQSNDGTVSDLIEISKKGVLLRKIRMNYPEYIGLATGLEKQYTYVRSDGFLAAYISMDSHKGEWIPANEEKIFTAMRKEMKEEDMKLYLSLPNKVTVYRGANVDELESEDYGFSWTLNLDIARKFATVTSPTKDRVILKAIVDKENIAAYTNAREEEECIINVRQEDCFDEIEIISSK